MKKRATYMGVLLAVVGALVIAGCGGGSSSSSETSGSEDARSTALGTTKRKDGSMQVTYEGHPVYTFSGDEAPGEANGQEFDGTWFVLDESGTAVKGTAT